MKRFAVAALALVLAAPNAAMARHRLHSGDGFEVEPSHCVHDAVFDSWNCWYSPVRKKRRRRAWPEYHDHHHVPYYRRYFVPNRHNNHGVPCYFYKDDNWCF